LGIGFFAPELVGDVITASLKAKGMAEQNVQAAAAQWKGINSIVQNLGAFFGMMTFTWVAQKMGRKPAFAIGFTGALITTFGYFLLFNGVGDIWMSAVMGFFQLALFAGFAIYLPSCSPPNCAAPG